MLWQAFKQVGFSGAVEGLKSYLLAYGTVMLAMYIQEDWSASPHTSLHDATDSSGWAVIAIMVLQIFGQGAVKVYNQGKNSRQNSN